VSIIANATATGHLQNHLKGLFSKAISLKMSGSSKPAIDTDVHTPQSKRMRLGGADKKDVTVSFEGQKGAYSEDAAIKLFQKQGFTTVTATGVASFRDVFEAVAAGKAEFGVIPVENSSSGTFHNVYDMLLASSLYIHAECSFTEEHCLCVKPGVTEDQIERVLSHPEILLQCSEFMQKMEKDSTHNVKKELYWDSAGACAAVAESSSSTAAIGSKRAAELNKLQILESHIGNDKNNETRYLVLSKEKLSSVPETLHMNYEVKYKCSVAVALTNEANSIFKVISCFALRNLSIFKLESRPASTAPDWSELTTATSSTGGVRHWDYLFYIDFEPAYSNEINEALMSNLKEFTIWVREFGVYQQNLEKVEAVRSPWHAHYC
jgi:arogenate/prephenate dehydratase